MHIFAHGPEPRRQIQHPARRELMTPHRDRGVIEARIEVEQHTGPPGKLLVQQPTCLLVLFERGLGHACLGVHEEEHLESDTADATARGLAEGIQEGA